MEGSAIPSSGGDLFVVLSALDHFARRQKVLTAADVIALVGRTELRDASVFWDAEERADLLAELRSRGFRIEFEPGGLVAIPPQRVSDGPLTPGTASRA